MGIETTQTTDAASSDRHNHDKERAEKGSWVQVHTIILAPEERSGKIPEDTRAVPLEMWVHGFLLNESARIGDTVDVETAIGRTVTGTLRDTHPGYTHTYGQTLPELARIGRQLKTLGSSLRRRKE